MGVVDFILNLAGLLLWLNWRANRFDPLVKRVPATLMGTLRPAAPKKIQRWHLFVFVILLLLFRALIYWWIGSAANWSAKLNLGVTVLWFSSGSHWIGFYRMACFSFLSFGVTLGTLYAWLLVLSLLGGPMPIHGLVKIPLGSIDNWPRWVKVILPFLVTASLWGLVSWTLHRLGVLAPATPAARFQQSLVLGVNSYLLWQFPLGAILLLHLLNSYIYFGKHAIWKYVNATAQAILYPLGKIPLRLGKVDFAPLVGIALIFFAAHFGGHALNALYNRLPF